MRTKNALTAKHLNELVYENIRLYVLLFYMDGLARDKFGMDLMVTSIFREENDPYGLHGNWQAADVRIFNHERDASENGDRPSEILPSEMGLLASQANQHLPYGTTWSGVPTESVKVRLASAGHHEDPSNDHAHVQVKHKRSWV